MGELLPLFPLGTVLYPGLVLPLHIFEDRYKQLVSDLLAGPEPKQFGVIAIKTGRETGVDGISALYDIGCTAVLRQVTELADGGFDLLTVGTTRYRLQGPDLDDSMPYLRAQVDPLAEVTGNKAEARAAVAAVRRGFRGYLDLLEGQGAVQINVPDLPEEPVLLSYLVAASMIIDLPDRQRLLASPDAVSRLGAERALLARESAMLRSLGVTPAPDLRSSPYNPN